MKRWSRVKTVQEEIVKMGSSSSKDTYREWSRQRKHCKSRGGAANAHRHYGNVLCHTRRCHDAASDESRPHIQQAHRKTTAPEVIRCPTCIKVYRIQ